MNLLPAQAEKILRLALNPAAHEGEWRAAAVKFISTLRESGCAPESIIEKCAAPAPRAEYAVPFFMPFGKYKGVSIRKVPTEYLSWMWASMDMDAPLKTAVRKELESRA